MKKIIISFFAVAALAACTKSEVQYDQPDAIGFQVVSGKMTKAAVEGTTYPEGLNMYVFAMTDNSSAANAEADYLDNAEFSMVSTVDGKKVWGGTPNPYYWPNIKKLFFAGVSKSGNVNAENNGVVPEYNNGVITLDGYVAAPGTEAQGDNDLMWFPTTTDSYGKGTQYVPAVMKHACSWITIKLEGDDYTAGKYFVTDIHIEGLTTKGEAELGTTANWTLSTEAAYTNQQFDVFTPAEDATGTALPAAGAATEEGFETVTNNTIVLPEQVPGTLSITYQFESQASETIVETVTGSLKFNGEAPWAAGTHYTYTVKITASQILIAPEVNDWTLSPATGGHGVTVQ